MEKEKLIYKIENVEYLLIEVFIDNNSKVEKYNKACEKTKSIQQGVKSAKTGGLFCSEYVIMKTLVPTKNIDEFQRNV